jgi:hypothetical protein
VREAKNVVVKMDGRAFTVEVDISDDDAIAAIISSLGFLTRRGLPIRIVQTSTQALSRSQSILTRVLKSKKDLGEWADDVKVLIRIQRTRI